MSKLIAGLLLSFSLISSTTAPTLPEIRALYKKATSEETSCKQLMNLLQPYNEDQPLYLGYRASATMMMASYVKNPFDKLSYFNQGKAMLQQAIEADEKNVELRFLRFGIQTNAPAFLGYNIHIAVDKLFLIQAVQSLSDRELKNNIVEYMRQSKYVSEQEKQQLPQ